MTPGVFEMRKYMDERAGENGSRTTSSSSSTVPLFAESKLCSLRIFGLGRYRVNTV